MLEAGGQRLVQGELLGVYIELLKVLGDGVELGDDGVLPLQGRHLRRHLTQEGQVLHELLH